MRKIVVGAQVSMDGVMQAPGGPTEDPTKGFKLGGWMAAYRSPEGGEELRRVFEAPFELLLGRKTYEIFAAYWPYQDEASPQGWIAKLFNGAKKYVVSRSGHVDTTWAGSVPLRDTADVKRLQQEDGPSLVTQGSTELVHTLLAHHLVDAMILAVRTCGRLLASFEEYRGHIEYPANGDGSPLERWDPAPTFGTLFPVPDAAKT